MMAAFIYNITLKSNVPLDEEDVEDAFAGLFGDDPDNAAKVQITEFDLEDAEYSEV